MRRDGGPRVPRLQAVSRSGSRDPHSQRRGGGTGSHNDVSSAHAPLPPMSARHAQRTKQVMRQTRPRGQSAPAAGGSGGAGASRAVEKVLQAKRSELKSGKGRNSKGMAMVGTRKHHQLVPRMHKAPQVRPAWTSLTLHVEFVAPVG